MNKELTNSQKRLLQKKEEKAEIFLEEVNKLQEKYKLRIIPTVSYHPDGIIASIKVVDLPQNKKVITEGEK